MKILSLLTQGFLAGGLAAAINIVIYFIAKSMGTLNDRVLLPPGKPLGPLPVIFSSLISAVVASVLLFVLFKTVYNPVTVFTIVGVAFLLLSLAGPFSIRGVPGRAKITLALMHIFAGVIIIFMLNKINN